jgi:hypothetical protein
MSGHLNAQEDGSSVNCGNAGHGHHIGCMDCPPALVSTRTGR